MVESACSNTLLVAVVLQIVSLAQSHILEPCIEKRGMSSVWGKQRKQKQA